MNESSAVNRLVASSKIAARVRVAGLFRDATDGSPVCITATLFDGLVLGRSAGNHSMNYRSVAIHGSPGR